MIFVLRLRRKGLRRWRSLRSLSSDNTEFTDATLNPTAVRHSAFDIRYSTFIPPSQQPLPCNEKPHQPKIITPRFRSPSWASCYHPFTPLHTLHETSFPDPHHDRDTRRVCFECRCTKETTADVFRARGIRNVCAGIQSSQEAE